MIIFLHGFGSSSTTSSTARAVKELYPDAVLADYDSLDPHKDIEKIKQLIDSQDSVILIGISLGGYLARYLAHSCESVTKLLLINPSLNAHENLAKKEGTVFNDVQLPDRFAYKYTDYRIRKDRPELEMFLYLGLFDEVVDCRDTVHELGKRAQITTAECGHRIVPNKKFQNWINSSIDLVLG